jgi:hypothetical protein
LVFPLRASLSIALAHRGCKRDSRFF